MLVPFYQNESDIPENLKGAYVQKNGRWELDTLADDHPLMVNKKLLEDTQKTLKTQNNELIQEKTRLESTSLPQGKVAVDPEIEKLGNAAKAANLKVSEMPTLKTKSDELQKKLDQRDALDLIGKAADANGINKTKFIKLLGDKELKVEETKETVDGKEQPVFRVVQKDKDGKEVKTLFNEYVEKDEFFGTFYNDLKAEQAEESTGVTFPQQKTVKTQTGKTVYDDIRAEAKEQQGTKQPTDTDSILSVLSGKPVTPAAPAAK